MTELRERVLFFVSDPADKLVAQFFDTKGRFAATTFDTLPDNPPNQFSTTDLLAVTLLDVALPPDSVRDVLDTKAGLFSELLTALPVDVDLWNATDDDLTNASALQSALHGLYRVKETRASKLMARKRPRLIPVIDSVIRKALTLSEDPRLDLRACLSDFEVQESIGAIRPKNEEVETISTIRLLDAAVWMRCSRSQHAQAAREKAGLRREPDRFTAASTTAAVRPPPHTNA